MKLSNFEKQLISEDETKEFIKSQSLESRMAVIVGHNYKGNWYEFILDFVLPIMLEKAPNGFTELVTAIDKEIFDQQYYQFL